MVERRAGGDAAIGRRATARVTMGTAAGSGYDAVIVGAGPNGLVAANVLADAGWRVLVLEAAQRPGGAVASEELAGGAVADVCSGFYPLAASSPAITRLGLEAHGLEWCRSPTVLAHVLPEGDAIELHQDAGRTAAELERRQGGDGNRWQQLSSLFDRASQPLLDALCTPFPPVRAAARLVRSLGAGSALRLARLATLSARRLGDEELIGPAGPLLMAGCCSHSDLTVDAAGGAFYGWFLAMMGQRVGFPVPKGGASGLAEALARRLEAAGGEIACGRTVERVTVRHGVATGVVDASGDAVRARRAVVAGVSATSLYGVLLPEGTTPPRLADDLRRFEWDRATVKVDWVLDGPVPWRAAGARRAGTVHVADSMDELTRTGAELATGEVPSRPFVVFGQPAVADPSRVRGGREALWAYSDVPRRVRGDPSGIDTGRWDERELAAFADRIEARVEQHAPGFRSQVLFRRVLGPAELSSRDANLVDGSRYGGTAGLHQQLAFRPVPGLGRPETAIRRLYLGSASAHPGGGVHGACGWNAARAALRAAGPGAVAGRAIVAAQRRLAR